MKYIVAEHIWYITLFLHLHSGNDWLPCINPWDCLTQSPLEHFHNLEITCIQCVSQCPGCKSQCWEPALDRFFRKLLCFHGHPVLKQGIHWDETTQRIPHIPSKFLKLCRYFLPTCLVYLVSHALITVRFTGLGLFSYMQEGCLLYPVVSDTS